MFFLIKFLKSCKVLENIFYNFNTTLPKVSRNTQIGYKCILSGHF